MVHLRAHVKSKFTHSCYITIHHGGNSNRSKRGRAWSKWCVNLAKNKRKRKRRMRNVSGSVYWLIIGIFVMCFAQEYPRGAIQGLRRQGGAERRGGGTGDRWSGWRGEQREMAITPSPWCLTCPLLLKTIFCWYNVVYILHISSLHVLMSKHFWVLIGDVGGSLKNNTHQPLSYCFMYRWRVRRSKISAIDTVYSDYVIRNEICLGHG